MTIELSHVKNSIASLRIAALYLILAPCVALSTSIDAMAGTVVEQSVVVADEGSQAKRSTRYRWQLGDRGNFRLDVSSPRGSVFFLFNGRVLYACSTISRDLAKKLGARKTTWQDTLGKLQKGSCQEAPANFLTTFFLSPHGTIAALDYSDGMEVTLTIDSYQVNAAPAASSSQSGKTPCRSLSRKYALKRARSSGTAMAHEIEETICVSPKADWRKKLWKKLRRDLIRQPKSRSLLATLKDDVRKFQGFQISGVTHFKKVDPTGKERKGRAQVTTHSVDDGKRISKKVFRIPSNYSVVDILGLSGEGSGSDDPRVEIEKNPVPELFYHFFGGLL